MIIEIDELEGLPVTTNPFMVSIWRDYVEMEREIDNAPAPEIARKAREANEALLKSHMDLIVHDRQPEMVMRSIAIVKEGGIPAGKKPKIKGAWKAHVDPVMHGLGFGGSGGSYARTRGAAEQSVQLNMHKYGGCFVIDLTLAPLALAADQTDWAWAMNSTIQARWFFDRTDIWWVSGFDEPTMESASEAAAAFLQRHVEQAFSELMLLVFSEEEIDSDARVGIIFNNLDQVRQRLADCRN